MIDIYDLFITFGRQKCIFNSKSSLYTKIVHYQLNWYKLHLKLHLCNPLMSNNPIGLNFVYKYVFHTTLDFIYWRELVVRGGGGFVHLSLANSFPIRLCTGTRQSRTPKPARAEGPSSIHSITKTKMAWVGPIHM